MNYRRGRSNIFIVGKIKSPYVLDLRKKANDEVENDEWKTIFRKRQANKTKQRPLKEVEPEGMGFVLPEELMEKDDLMRELDNIEQYDIQLASNIRRLEEEPQEARFINLPIKAQAESSIARESDTDKNIAYSLEDRVDTFLSKKNNKSDYSFTREVEVGEESPQSARAILRRVKNFAVVTALIATSLFSGFFAQRILAAKEKTIARSMEAYQSFISAEQSLRDLNFSGASKDFSKAYENLVAAEESLKEVGKTTIAIVENIPFESRADSSLSLLTAAKHLAGAGEILSSAFTFLPLDSTVSITSVLTILNSEDKNSASYIIDVFNEFAEKLSLAKIELLQAKKRMENVRAEDFPLEFQESIAGLGRKIPQLLSLVQLAEDYSKISNILLGADAPKRYLVLFQNSSELRPSGGFIGTYAIIEVDNGELKDMLVEGIYEADGQLTVNIVPPKPFQHIATGWSTHDANWFLDFPASAQKIMWFYERTGGGKVDGVLTLNVEVIERLLALTGPVTISEYDLTLNADNFRDEIQYEVEAAYDKKLNRPKKVLTDFTPIFLNRLLTISREGSKEIVTALMDAIEQKYMMFYFTDARMQEFFDSQGWSGAIHRTSNREQAANEDYLAIVHSNIGGYKTDKYVKDNVEYRGNIKEDGSIIVDLTIKRTHNGGDLKFWWYNRRNIDYVKIYVPQGAKIISSSGGLRRELEARDYSALHFEQDADIARIEQGAKFFGHVDIFEESGKTVFGTWLITNQKSSSELKISYQLPFKVEFHNDAGKYNLYWQKQPGTAAQAKITLNIPKSWESIWTNSEEEKLEQLFSLDKDRVVGYIFSK